MSERATPLLSKQYRRKHEKTSVRTNPYGQANAAMAMGFAYPK